MSNRWKEIWDKKSAVYQKSDDVFEMFKLLKKADGFDVMANEGYYEAFFKWSYVNK